MTGFQNRIAGVTPRQKRPIQWRNTLESFGLRAQLFHAILGFAVLVMLVVGLTMDYWPKATRNVAYTLHKGLGLWIFVFAIIWFVHWWRQVTPAQLPTQPMPSYKIAKLVHKILLVLCIVMPLSGWIMVSAFGSPFVIMAPYLHMPAIAKTDPDFAKAMQGVHIVLAWSLISLVALHIAGALYHHFKGDPIVKRIIPRFKAPAGYYRFQFDQTVRAHKKHTKK
jgi:cytochrome b561